MSTTSVSHVTSSFFTIGGETTSGKLLIPSTVTPGHDLYVMVASRGHTDATAYPTVTDTDAAGNTFALEGATGSRKGTLFWKKATSGTSGKLITVAGASQSCSGILSVYSGGLASGDPTTNLAAETNNLGSNTHAAFTPSNASSMICFAAFQYTGTPTLSMSSMSATEVLPKRAEYLSTGGSDSGVVHGSSFQSVPITTGTFRWQFSSAQTSTSMVWAIQPQIITVTPADAPTSVLQNPMHTYGSAGTYIVRLTVTDNDGNSSSTTKAFHVS